ncbi:MAG: hypothetical protein ACP5QR_16500 [Rhizomicrobium sp.]
MRRVLADRGRIGNQFDDNDVEHVEHVVLRARLQRADEREQRRCPPLRWQSCHGLRFGDRREPGQRHDPSGRDVRNAG